MTITYSGRSRYSAERIANAGGFDLNRGGQGDVNWGRNQANTELNPDISNSTNKRIMREMFRDKGVPMPKLLTHGNVIYDAREMGITWDYPILGRPDSHMKGRGLWKCYNIRDIERALRGTRRKKAATHFMEWIDAPREYRVHIFKGKSIRISEKKFSEDGEYTTVKPEHRVKHVRKAAKKAVKALGLDFGAVDVLANDDDCWVLEVNAAPGLGGSMPELYARVFKQYMEGEWDE